MVEQEKVLIGISLFHLWFPEPKDGIMNENIQ